MKCQFCHSELKIADVNETFYIIFKILNQNKAIDRNQRGKSIKYRGRNLPSKRI